MRNQSVLPVLDLEDSILDGSVDLEEGSKREKSEHSRGRNREREEEGDER